MHLVQQLDNWSVWAVPNPAKCPCNGGGWLLSDYDTFHKCGLHGGTPHPEDDDGFEGFDFDAHRAAGLRKAFVAYRNQAGMSPVDFKVAVIQKAGAGSSPQEFVNAAEIIAEEARYLADEGIARAEGYSCGLEMRLADEAVRERQENGLSW